MQCSRNLLARAAAATLLSFYVVACSGGASSAITDDKSATTTSVPSPVQPHYEYRDAACDPNDSRITAAKIKLPPKQLLEGRIAAACVALEWIANKNATYPTPEIIAPERLGKSARQSLAESAGWQLRFLWSRRADTAVSKPSIFLFDSKEFACSSGIDYLSLGHPLRAECAQSGEEWTCADYRTSGKPAAWKIAWAAQRDLWLGPRAGLQSFYCTSESENMRVNPFKFYLGLLGCDTGAEQLSLCYHWSHGANYIFGLYLEELGLAELESRPANLDLCPKLKWPGWCPEHPRLFKGYVSSKEWLTLANSGCWPGSEPYGVDGECSRAEALDFFAKGYAFEWITAHFGVDAAFGLASATQAAGRDRGHYIDILEAYTGLSAESLFTLIDRYVVARLGDRIR